MSFWTFLNMEITREFEPTVREPFPTTWQAVQLAIIASPFVAYVMALLWSMR